MKEWLVFLNVFVTWPPALSLLFVKSKTAHSASSEVIIKQRFCENFVVLRGAATALLLARRQNGS